MKGAGNGLTREGAMREGASEEITRATHLTAVYPALFKSLLLSFAFFFPSLG